MGCCCGPPEESSLFYLMRFTPTDICRLQSARVMDIAPPPQTHRPEQAGEIGSQVFTFMSGTRPSSAT
jgi:hypothetical protein